MTLNYHSLYAGPDGESHLAELDFDFQPLPGMPDLTICELPGTGNASLLKLRPGAVEDWHTAPREAFLVVVQGRVELTVSDGTRRELGPGALLLMADTTGKGHLTANRGNEEHIALVIPVTAPGGKQV